jgi:hypothetical protein
VNFYAYDHVTLIVLFVGVDSMMSKLLELGCNALVHQPRLYARYPLIDFSVAGVDLYWNGELYESFPRALFYEADRRMVGLYGVHIPRHALHVLEEFDPEHEDEFSAAVRQGFGPDQRRLIECMIKLTTDYNAAMPLAGLFLENAHRYEYLTGQAYIRADLDGFLERFSDKDEVEIAVDNQDGQAFVYPCNIALLRSE